MPRNLKSGKAYRGINVFLLHAMGYESPHWVTFKQAKERGGSVRKGEKSTPVIFWNWIDQVNKSTGKDESIPFLKRYNVFNVAQCDEIDAPPVVVNERTELATLTAAQAVVDGMPKAPAIEHGYAKACYSPTEDKVMMPGRDRFDTCANYFSVLFHEMVHSTGHESRLKREGITSKAAAFGDTTYSKEELVAEMGAAYLSGHAGILHRTVEQSASYVAGWLKALKNDNKLVIQAAGQAQKAADHILNVKWEK